MALRKDMRREDLSRNLPIHLILSVFKRLTISTLVIPYKEPSAEKPDDIANTLATTLPMVAVSLAQLVVLLWLT